MRSAALAGALLFSVSLPVAADAQTRKIEITVGAAVSGPSSAGATRAELLDSAGNPITMFEATHRTTVGLGVDAGLLYRLRPGVALALSGSWVRPDFETTISGDLEGAGDTGLTLGMHRFSADAALVRHFSRRGAAEPYLHAGAGWFRELTTDRTLVADGVAGHVGGGLKYWVREVRTGLLGHIAIRADVRLTVLRGGITLGESGTRWFPSASAGFVLAR